MCRYWASCRPCEVHRPESLVVARTRAVLASGLELEWIHASRSHRDPRGHRLARVDRSSRVVVEGGDRGSIESDGQDAVAGEARPPDAELPSARSELDVVDHLVVQVHQLVIGRPCGNASARRGISGHPDRIDRDLPGKVDVEPSVGLRGVGGADLAVRGGGLAGDGVRAGTEHLIALRGDDPGRCLFVDRTFASGSNFCINFCLCIKKIAVVCVLHHCNRHIIFWLQTI